jgi:hypothetical protein
MKYGFYIRLLLVILSSGCLTIEQREREREILNFNLKTYDLVNRILLFEIDSSVYF